jgi:Protein of unknown function (DUF1566)
MSSRQAQQPAAPAAIGAPYGGGFYAGLIRIGDAVHALIVAPKARGEAVAAWDGADDPLEIEGAGSYFDGAANTTTMAQAGLPIAQWAQALAIGGHTDWHLPSRDELEVCYRAFKPSTHNNIRFSGDNPSAVPVTWPYALQTPAQTCASDFQEGGAEAFECRWYWSSTQYSGSTAWSQDFTIGPQGSSLKSYEGRARAVRTIQLTA